MARKKKTIPPHKEANQLYENYLAYEGQKCLEKQSKYYLNLDYYLERGFRDKLNSKFIKALTYDEITEVMREVLDKKPQRQQSFERYMEWLKYGEVYEYESKIGVYKVGELI